jgi:hypothetical protein
MLTPNVLCKGGKLTDGEQFAEFPVRGARQRHGGGRAASYLPCLAAGALNRVGVLRLLCISRAKQRGAYGGNGQIEQRLFPGSAKPRPRLR